MNDIHVLSHNTGGIDQVSARQWIEAALGRAPARTVAGNYIWVLMGGIHQSYDPRDHYCLHGFRQDGHVYKTLHIYSNVESQYFKDGRRKFGVRYGKTLDLLLECENLGYVIFHKFLISNG
ncbi:hypothetical protein BYT27DRAFT_7107721 [Phlegmacium glaucopus]|nr:hypothetical protein BYT27DRAFT_7107721 [Phlegmacium glaucopus]